MIRLIQKEYITIASKVGRTINKVKTILHIYYTTASRNYTRSTRYDAHIGSFPNEACSVPTQMWRVGVGDSNISVTFQGVNRTKCSCQVRPSTLDPCVQNVTALHLTVRSLDLQILKSTETKSIKSVAQLEKCCTWENVNGSNLNN